eukprot:Pgem_evm1s15640
MPFSFYDDNDFDDDEITTTSSFWETDDFSGSDYGDKNPDIQTGIGYDDYDYGYDYSHRSNSTVNLRDLGDLGGDIQKCFYTSA